MARPRRPPIMICFICVAMLFSGLHAYPRDDNYLEVGLQTYYQYYSEIVPAPLKSQETGPIVGATFGYYYLPKAWPVFQYIGVDVTYFPTYYDGTTQLGDPVRDYTNNIFFLLEENLGYTFFPSGSQRVSVTPYLGVAYRYWKRMLGGSFPYSEEYSWFNMPIGLRASLPLGGWDVCFDVSARVMFLGKLIIHLTDVDPLFEDAETALGNRLGLKLRTHFSYQLKKATLRITPWFEYSSIGRSDVFPIYFDGSLATYAYEPSSNTFKFGLDTCVRFLVY